MIDIKHIKKFANELKMKGVRYEYLEGSKIKLKQHWDGLKIVSGDDMRTMCSKHFKREYNLLTDGEKTKVRKEVFRHLRGKNNG